MMKRVILFLFISGIAIAQSGTIKPSFYYTNGNYSNSRSSSDVTINSLYNITPFDYVIASFDNIIINDNVEQWNYNQKFLLIGGLKNYYPFYVKLNYGFIQGNYTYEPISNIYDYQDKSHLLSSEIIYNHNLQYYGISYNYLNIDGAKKSVVMNNAGLYFGSYIGENFFVSVKPYFDYLNDGRELWSGRIKLVWIPIKNMDISIATSVGERAYFFDTEYLTIFNQNETQDKWYELRANYNVNDKLSFVGLYQYTHFKENSNAAYIIRYIGGGFSYRF